MPELLRRACTLILLCCAAISSGCLGSPEAYHPGYDERPEQIKLEDAESRARRLAVPKEIIRNSSYYAVGRKEISRMMGEIPKNVFRGYEVDIDDAFPPVLAERTLRRPPYYLKVLKKQAVEVEEEEAGEDDGGGEEGEEGDEGDEGDDEFEDEEDWDEE